MGYCVHYQVTDLIITCDNVPACLAALNELDEKMGNRRLYLGKEMGAHTDILEAIHHHRFSGERRDCGAVEILYWDGDKSWEEERFFSTIAPFVNPGGMIKGLGEDGEKWRYLFRDGKCFRQDGIEAWDEAGEYEV